MTQPPTASQSKATQVVEETISGSGVSSAMTSRSGDSVGISSAYPGGSGESAAGTAAGTGASGTSLAAFGSSRKRFAAEELAIVLSHYDLGVLSAVQEFPRGSRKAPKLVIKTQGGQMYLLKRRSPGKDDAFKVAFCHGMQLHLADRKFPLPHLIGTRKDNNSMLQWKGGVYELFEYIKGGTYDNSLEATTDAGKILALFHKLLRDYKPQYEPAQGSYHAAKSVDASMRQIPQTLTRLSPQVMADHRERVGHLIQFLHTSYRDAAKRVEKAGLSDWPDQIIHCDWHPGNMLFRGSRVVAVIDYDAARIQQRVIDVANGALQFSILGGSDDPSKWPDYIDESRFKRFLRGYDSVPGAVLSHAELRVIPWLMIEALIAESVIPIAATGSFARMEGVGFMEMVRRKVRWLQKHAGDLVKAVES